MTTHDQTFSTAFAPSRPAGSFASWIKSIGGQIATWADTCADYYAAAAMYEQLAALSFVAARVIARNPGANVISSRGIALSPIAHCSSLCRSRLSPCG